jgi:hypothetical protein
VFLHDYANAIWSLKRPKGPFILSWLPLFNKNLNHIAKDASIFHPKLAIAMA